MDSAFCHKNKASETILMNYIDPRYRDLCVQVRELDPTIYIGMASEHEIARLQGLVEKLTVKKAAEPPSQRDLLLRELNELRRQYHQAGQQITEAQARMKLRRQDYEEIGTPSAYFEAPEPIESSMPSLSDEVLKPYLDRFARRTNSIRILAQEIAHHVRDVENSTPGDIARRAVRHLGVRVKKLEDAQSRYTCGGGNE